MLVSKEEDLCTLRLGAKSHVLLFGGIPFEEERHIFWNFVASNKELIDKAKEDRKTQKFDLMQDDDSYVSLP